MTTFITRMDSTGTGIRLAVKDLIDVAGVPTTAGSRAVAQSAIAACHDAECMAGARAAGARIVGKTNLHELALGTSGVNEWFGTPVNPIDPRLVPGGSSSGSAVAVATGEADVAFGTDTGGSIRIPSACCGTTGLKTTWGRVSLKGVYPCAPSLDTVGPMARDVRGVIAGMQLLEPGFAPDPIPPAVVGRLRVPASPEIDKAIDSALSAAGFEIVDLEIPGWKAAGSAASAIIMSEVWAANRALATGCRDKIGADVLARLDLGAAFRPEEVRAAHAAAGAWQAELHLVFERVELLALPTLAEFPPTLERAQDVPTVRCTLQVNIAGVPALAIPVPAGGPVPASLQLVGPSRTEERLVAAGLLVERALA